MPFVDNLYGSWTNSIGSSKNFDKLGHLKKAPIMHRKPQIFISTVTLMSCSGSLGSLSKLSQFVYPNLAIGLIGTGIDGFLIRLYGIGASCLVKKVKKISLQGRSIFLFRAGRYFIGSGIDGFLVLIRLYGTGAGCLVRKVEKTPLQGR